MSNPNWIVVELEGYLSDCPPHDESIDESLIPEIVEEVLRRYADYLDSMAETEPGESEDKDGDWGWGGVEEISNEERHACDLYNERYVMPYCD